MNKTVEAAQAQMEASNKRAEYAETKLGRAQQLFASRATAEDELDRANLQYWEGQLGFRQDSLTVEAMNSIRAATALLPQMVADYIAHKGLSRAVLEKQKLEAEARLRQILIERQRGVMRSPVDGLVLQRLIEDEQFLNAGTELLTIGQLDALEVETDILSQDVVRISTGDPVEVYGPAVGGGLGHGVPGTVHQIYPAGFTKISSLGVEQQRVKVVIRLPSDVVQRLQEREVGVDYRVRARIFTAQQDDALLVPRSALFRGPDGQWQLFVIRRNRAVLRRVELGLANDEHAQIVRGLEEGESVILAPETRLTHGTRVTPVP
jgi:HlyD family secretion protein